MIVVLGMLVDQTVEFVGVCVCVCLEREKRGVYSLLLLYILELVLSWMDGWMKEGGGAGWLRGWDFSSSFFWGC